MTRLIFNPSQDSLPPNISANSYSPVENHSTSQGAIFCLYAAVVGFCQREVVTEHVTLDIFDALLRVSLQSTSEAVRTSLSKTLGSVLNKVEGQNNRHPPFFRDAANSSSSAINLWFFSEKELQGFLQRVPKFADLSACQLEPAGLRLAQSLVWVSCSPSLPTDTIKLPVNRWPKDSS